MRIIQNVPVNFKNEKDFRFIPQFYEWTDDDLIQHIEELAVFSVTKELLEFVSYGMNPIPEKLLSYAAMRSHWKVRGLKQPMTCCFGLSDGETCLIIDTEGTDTPLRKSRTTFEKEDEFLQVHAHYPEIRLKLTFSEFQMNPYPLVDYTGLTRKEREKKRSFLRLFPCHHDSTEKIRYFLMEWGGISLENASRMEKDTMLWHLRQLTTGSWTEKHEKLLLLFQQTK